MSTFPQNITRYAINKKTHAEDVKQASEADLDMAEIWELSDGKYKEQWLMCSELKWKYKVEAEDKVGGQALPDIKTYYKSTVIRTVQLARKTNRSTDQNRESRINICKYSQQISDKRTKAIQWKKRIFLTNSAGTTGRPHAKKNCQQRFKRYKLLGIKQG